MSVSTIPRMDPIRHLNGKMRRTPFTKSQPRIKAVPLRRPEGTLARLLVFSIKNTDMP